MKLKIRFDKAVLSVSLIFVTACGNGQSAREVCERNVTLDAVLLTSSQKSYLKEKLIEKCTQAFSPCSSDELALLERKGKKALPLHKVSQSCGESVQNFTKNFQAIFQSELADTLKR